MLKDELDELSGKLNTQLSEAERREREYSRKEKYGHAKDLMEKLHPACSNMHSTLENIPKVVERMEQKRKMHEMCA